MLEEVVALLKLRPDAPAILGGHTDSKDKHEYKGKLSERRTASVRDYLVAKGIAAAHQGTGNWSTNSPSTSFSGPSHGS